VHVLPTYNGNALQEEETGRRGCREGKREAHGSSAKYIVSSNRFWGFKCFGFVFNIFIPVFFSSALAKLKLVGVPGPTAAVHLLHSQPIISSRVYESYDQRYHHTWEISKNGDGLISVENRPEDEKQVAQPKPINLRVEPEVIQNLLNAYFKEIAPLLPVVTQAEFLANPSPPPILLYSMCLVAAARREVPQSIFDSIRYAVNSVIKGEDVLSTASIANVQALLILCMMGDSHSQFVPNALSALWIRLGTAIRMVRFCVI